MVYFYPNKIGYWQRQDYQGKNLSQEGKKTMFVKAYEAKDDALED